MLILSMFCSAVIQSTHLHFRHITLNFWCVFLIDSMLPLISSFCVRDETHFVIVNRVCAVAVQFSALSNVMVNYRVIIIIEAVVCLRLSVSCLETAGVQRNWRHSYQCDMVSSAYPEHYLVGVCNEFRSPSAYWPATALRYCADQTPEVVWPRGPGRQVSRSFQCSTSLHIACPKELEAASRSSKTYLAKNGGGRSAPI